MPLKNNDSQNEKYEEFHKIFNRFLLVDIEPTVAACSSVQYLSGEKSERHNQNTRAAEADKLALNEELFQEEPDFLLLSQDEPASLQKYVSSFLSSTAKKLGVPKNIPLEKFEECKAAFKNFFALNSSFLLNDRNGDVNEALVNKVTVDDPGIEFRNLSKFYSTLVRYLEENNDAKSERQIINNLRNLCQRLTNSHSQHLLYPSQLRFVFIILENPMLDDLVQNNPLHQLFQLVDQLDGQAKQILENWYKNLPVENMKRHVTLVQQLITISLLPEEDSIYTDVIDNVKRSPGCRIQEACTFLNIIHRANRFREDYLSPEDSLDYTEFCNNAITDSDKCVEIVYRTLNQEHVACQSLAGKLAEFYFLFDAATKGQFLRNSSIEIQQYQVRHSILRQMMGEERRINPYLLLRVRREHIIQDTLNVLSQSIGDGLESDLQKQLRVHFEDEEGIDEGGVTKEFFQLLVSKLFNPMIGMFYEEPGVNLMWFSRQSFESTEEFHVVGIVLGLAIYNGVILDVHFPMAVYKKLLGWNVTIEDLREFQPAMAQSLEWILTASEDDLEAADLSFSVTIEDGLCGAEPSEIPLGDCSIDTKVSIYNRQNFVKSKLNWIINESIQQNFGAFSKGFESCCGGRFLKIFRPEELQLLICGSPVFDFWKLKLSTIYQDGYTKNSLTVQHFWQVVFALSAEKQRKLLAFISGSDRVPIKGLSSLDFHIGRKGPDSQQLPTAHTCFNYLLLPDYQNKEKLSQLLNLAIENYQGFGLR